MLARPIRGPLRCSPPHPPGIGWKVRRVSADLRGWPSAWANIWPRWWQHPDLPSQRMGVDRCKSHRPLEPQMMQILCRFLLIMISSIWCMTLYDVVWCCIWLVVYLPLWKIWLRQLGLLFPIYGEKNMFQTTNQVWFGMMFWGQHDILHQTLPLLLGIRTTKSWEQFGHKFFVANGCIRFALWDEGIPPPEWHPWIFDGYIYVTQIEVLSKSFCNKKCKKKLKISGWDVHWSGFWNFDSSFLAFDPA